MAIPDDIARLRADMDAKGIAPERGLGRELFLFASSLAPVVNVDLLVMNDSGEVLLSWRDDPHNGRGWHFPGGCLRLWETLSERVRKVAESELGVPVRHAPSPAGIYEIFIRGHRDGIADQRERSHFIALPFACRVAGGAQPAVGDGDVRPGDMRWFGALPDDLLAVQACYRDDWERIYNTAWRDYHGILDE